MHPLEEWLHKLVCLYMIGYAVLEYLGGVFNGLRMCSFTQKAGFTIVWVCAQIYIHTYVDIERLSNRRK